MSDTGCKMSYTLFRLFKDWVKEVGPTEAARQLVDPRKGEPVTLKSVQNWVSERFQPPLWAVQHVYSLRNKEVDEFDGNLQWEGEKLRICIPTFRGVSAKTLQAALYLSNKHKGKVALDTEEQTLVYIARNNLAHRFMQSESVWLLFLDDDMVPPIGVPGKMQNWGYQAPLPFQQFDIITRLVSRGKTLVSGLYFDRHGKGLPMYEKGRNDQQERKMAQNAPYDVVKPTDWTGAGCLLIHRTVFEAIRDSQTEDIKPIYNGVYRYFDELPGKGEDVSFCLRAKACGHQPHVDMGCVVGHEGSKVFWQK